MPSSKSTIFFLAALAVVGPVAMTQPANALQGMGPPPARRAEHIEVAHKMIKKRSPKARVVPIRRQGPPVDTNTSTSTTRTAIDIIPDPTTATTLTSVTSAPVAPVIPTTTDRTTTTDKTTSNTRNTATETSTTSATTTRATTSSTSTTSSTTQQTSVTSDTSTTPQTTAPDTATQASSTKSGGRSTVLVTATSVASALPQETDKSKDEGASFLPKPVIVSLIVAASCVVGAAAIWTIIRKWKFGASRRFEDRLEPINWEPTTTTGLPIDERDPAAVAIARGNSVTSHRTRNSFGSSDGTHVGGAGGRSMTAVGDQPVTFAPDFPPPHDFTAGPSHLAPGAGYADLQRGPSPAPSMNYGGYGQQQDSYGGYGQQQDSYGGYGQQQDNYGGYGQQHDVPNPYDAYNYNGAYGGVQQPPHNNGPGPHQF